MILVTGGTGFIGQALIRRLVEDGEKVRVLLRPSKVNPDLPKGMPVDVAISNITDRRSLQIAMIGVETVYHLVGGEWLGTSGDLNQIEILGTRTLIEVCKEAGVKHIIYLSHLGADRASAYPVLKVKGIVEEFIRKSGIKFSIIRSGLVFGPGDHFTADLAKLFSAFPFIFPIPGDGKTLVHPIWIEDLAACLAWTRGMEELENQTVEIGGPELLSIREVVQSVLDARGVRRRLVKMHPVNLRAAAVFFEYFFSGLPLSVYWIDYLAANRTCQIETISRVFGLLPERFRNHLDHVSIPRRRASLLSLKTSKERRKD